MNFCPNCGKELTSNAAFCPNCGTALQKKEEKKILPDATKIKSPKNGMKVNKKLVAIVCAAVVILGAIIGVIASISAKKKEEAMVNAVIGTEWRVFHAGLDGYIDVIFKDEDTLLYDLGPGEGTDEYEWWVEKVDGNRLVFNTNPVAQDIYDEGGSHAEWYDLGKDYSVSFNKSGSTYMPYALIDTKGNIKDTK